MPRKTISKTVKKTGLILVVLIAVVAGIFLFTRPMLAPGFESPDFSPTLNNKTVTTGETYSNPNSNVQVGEKVKADSYLIFDELTGKTIAERKPDTPVAIASITKLMTAYVVSKYGDLNSTWAINSASTSDINPVLGLVVGDQVIINDLVNAMIIGSANDAASALGQYVTTKSGQPMIDLMNKEAKALGMRSTHYENPIGFDSEQNYSTANDLKLLLDAIRPITLFSSLDRKLLYTFTSETGKTYSVKTTNSLLAKDPDIHAIKTGFTDEARGAMITAIHKSNVKFVIIVLGSSDREEDTLLLKAQILKSFNL